MLSYAQFTALRTIAIEDSLFPESELHGEDHWKGVAAQAILLANTAKLGQYGRLTGLLFGLVHDCRRVNDCWDPEHGERSAAFLLSYAPDLVEKFPHLIPSLEGHDKGETTDCVLTGLGWDSDRSLLQRVGITPKAKYFSVLAPSLLPAFIARGDCMILNPPSWESLYQQAVG